MNTVPSESRSSIEQLLHDARLVYDYGIRVGRLPDNALADALDGVELAIEESRRPHAHQLAAALGPAIKAIEPVTLLDLRSGRSPFDPKYQDQLKWRQYRLVTITVLLASLIAYYSIALHRQENALRDLEAIQDSQITEKVGSLRKLVQQEKIFETKDSRYDQYRRLLGELRDLEARRKSVYERIDRLSKESNWPYPSIAIYSWLEARYTWLTTHLASSNAANKTGADSLSARINTATSSNAATTPSPYTDICLNRSSDTTLMLHTTPVWIRGLSSEQLDEFCFLQRVQLGYGIANYVSPLEAVGLVREKTILESAWILPFLSGLLGAAVYLLRDALNPRTATIGSTQSAVRLSMGGIAGIIIGWFWAPTSSAAAGLGIVSSVPFAIAFITGFSIEIFFSILDRLNRSIVSEGTDRGKGKP